MFLSTLLLGATFTQNLIQSITSPPAQQWWGHARSSVSVSWLSRTRETQAQQRESADMCSSASSQTLSWRQPCRHMMCDTSAWSPVNWRHTAWICIYLLVGFVQERNWPANWGESILRSCAKINIPCTVLLCKTSLGSTCRSGFAQIICGLLGLTLLLLYKSRTGQSRADYYGIT